MSEQDLHVRRLKLKRQLEELREMRGFGTELVTVYIPPGRQVSDVRQQLQQEHGLAANIKSKSTRKHVQGAIESALSSLAGLNQPGERGMALFVGEVVVGNNKTRMVNVTVDDPPEEIQSFRYRCDSSFELDQLESMLIDRAAYGLFVIDRSEACFGIAVGTRIHVQEYMPSQVPSKHGRGGQSAQRFERLIEEAAHNFFKKASEHACDYWLPMLDDLRGIIIGGPGATKDFVVRNEYFHHEIQKRIVETLFDVGYSNESGLRELVDRAGGAMRDIELDEERKIMDRFLRQIVQAAPKATYGEMMVRSALDQGAVETLLLSEGLRKRRHAFTCGTCGHEWEQTTDRGQSADECPNCDAHPDGHEVREETDLADELAALAERSSSEVRYISVDTEEGNTLLAAFGGLGAMLRYSIG